MRGMDMMSKPLGQGVREDDIVKRQTSCVTT